MAKETKQAVIAKQNRTIALLRAEAASAQINRALAAFLLSEKASIVNIESNMAVGALCTCKVEFGLDMDIARKIFEAVKGR